MGILVPDHICRNVHEIATSFVLVSLTLLIAQFTLAADAQVTDTLLEESAITVSTRQESQISLYDGRIEALETEFGPYHHTLLEPLQGLTALLIDSGDFVKTSRILNRRLQLLHILEGPTSLNQLPVLAELISHDVRLQRWQSVTDRFEYILSLHVQSPEVDTTALLNAMNDVSAWRSTYMFIDRPANRLEHLDTVREIRWKMITLSETQLTNDNKARISWLYSYALEQHRQFVFNWSQTSDSLLPKRSSYRPEFHGPVAFLRGALDIMKHILEITEAMDDLEAEAMAMIYVADFQMLLGAGTATSTYQSAEEKFKEAGIDQQRIEAFFARPEALPVSQFHLSLDAAHKWQNASGYILELGGESAASTHHLGDFIAWNRRAPSARLPALPEAASAASTELIAVQVQFSIYANGTSRDAKADRASPSAMRFKSVAQNAIKAMRFRPKSAQRGGQRIGDVTMNYMSPSER